MKCLNCGQENPDGTKFCTSCGTKFEEKKEEKVATIENPFANDAQVSSNENVNVDNNAATSTSINEVSFTQENLNNNKDAKNNTANVVSSVKENDSTNTAQMNVPKPNIVLGILSIVFAPIFALVGLILGIISIVKGKKIKKISKDAKVTPMYVLGGIGIGISAISMIVSLIFTIVFIGTIFTVTEIEDEFQNNKNDKIEKIINDNSSQKSQYTTSDLKIEFDLNDWNLSGSSLTSKDAKVKINLPTSASEESKITSDISSVSSSQQAYKETIEAISSDALTIGKGSNKYIRVNSSTYYMSVSYEQTISSNEEGYGKIYVVGHKEGKKTVFCLFKTFFNEEDYKYEDDVEDDVIDMIKNMEFTKQDDNKEDESKNSSITKTKESSEDSLLAFGEWGNASRYSKSEYVDVPVKLTNITRGEEAAKILKEYCESKKTYKYTDPKINMEWVIIEYQADLTNVYEYTMGRSVRVDSKIQAIGGGSLKYNDVTYFLTTTDMSESYSKETIANGKFAVQLPVGCKDYMIVMGSSSSEATKAYFRGK